MYSVVSLWICSTESTFQNCLFMFGDFWTFGRLIALRYQLLEMLFKPSMHVLYVHVRTQTHTSDQSRALPFWSPLVFSLQTHIIGQRFSLSLFIKQLWVWLSSSSPSKGRSLHSCFTPKIDAGSQAVSVKMATAVKTQQKPLILEKNNVFHSA